MYGGVKMRKGNKIFYDMLLLTGANFLLRLAGMSFQVYLSSRIGAAGIGLLQLVLSVAALAFTVGSAAQRQSPSGMQHPGCARHGLAAGTQLPRFVFLRCFCRSSACTAL